jgi:hypothetical protein
MIQNNVSLFNNFKVNYSAPWDMTNMFSPSTPVSSTNKTDRYNITEILLKVALNTITLTVQLRLNLNNKFVYIIPMLLLSY